MLRRFKLSHIFLALTERTKREFFRWLKKVPMVQRKIAEEMGKVNSSIEETFNKSITGDYLVKLPQKGLTDVCTKNTQYLYICFIGNAYNSL